MLPSSMQPFLSPTCVDVDLLASFHLIFVVKSSFFFRIRLINLPLETPSWWLQVGSSVENVFSYSRFESPEVFIWWLSMAAKSSSGGPYISKPTDMGEFNKSLIYHNEHPDTMDRSKFKPLNRP